MSLITDALQRARQEAARQEALKQRSPYPWMAVPGSDGRQARTALLVGLLAGCLAAVLVGGAVWWFAGRDPRPAPAAERVADAAAPAPQAEAVPSSPAAVPTLEEIAEPRIDEAPAMPDAAAEPPAVAPAPNVLPDPPAPRAAERPPALPEPRAAAPEAPAATAPVATAPSPSPAAVGLEDGKSYVRQISAPGGGTVQLSGIAFSEENPVALFGDRILVPGDDISGFTLVKVEAQRVELQGHGVTVFVTLK